MNDFPIILHCECFLQPPRSPLPHAHQQSAADNRKLEAERTAKLQAMAKKVRKHMLYVPFVDTLGHSDGGLGTINGAIDSEIKAKQLAFYMYWNIKALHR